MSEDGHSRIQISLPGWMSTVLGLPWLEILGETLKISRKLLRGLAQEGMYEVLDYESTLELLDDKGEKAKVQKRERVRYLQDYIIAYQDQAWGDGEILLNYRCSPGKAVDRYKPGYKTYILISLQEVKRRGDVDVFNIEWNIRDGFIREKELWETEVRHRTRKLTLNIIFPQSRPPHRVVLLETIRQHISPLSETNKNQLPDGRWLISWQTKRPRLYERYCLEWEW